MTAPINRGTDPVSERVYALILNGITRCERASGWLMQDEREQLADAVYAELREGGIEIRLAGPLAVLRDVNARLAGEDPDPLGSCPHVDKTKCTLPHATCCGPGRAVRWPTEARP